MSIMELHSGQSDIYEALFIERSIRHAVTVCCRGWGKSHLGAVCAISAVNELLQMPHWVPNKNVFIIAPTYAQVTDIYHPLIVYQLGMENYCIKHSKDTGRIWFPNNVELRLLSYEAVERMRGMGAYFVVNDEVRDWTKGNGFKDAWESIILPCVNTRWSKKRALQFGALSPGRSLTISTPKGYDDLYDMYNNRERDKEWGSFHYDYKRAPLLDLEEVETARHTMDPIRFAREYLASFKESGNSVFYCFDRAKHVRNDLPYFERGNHNEMGEDVHIGIDFNVGIQASSAFAIRGKQIHYLREFKGAPNTEELATAIKNEFWPNYDKPGHQEYKKKTCRIFVYPDPTGKARKTSAPIGYTDLAILEANGFTVRARNSSPPIVDSVQAVNRLLLTAAGETYLYFSTNVPGVISSMERTAWVDDKPDTAQIEKKSGNEHFSDGVRYPMEYLFPVQAGTKRVAKGFSF